MHEIHHIYVYKKNNDRRRDFMDQIFAGEFSGKDSVGVLRQNVWMGSILYGLMLSQEYRKFPLQGITFFDLHKWSSEKPNNKPKAYCWRHATVFFCSRHKSFFRRHKPWFINNKRLGTYRKMNFNPDTAQQTQEVIFTCKIQNQNYPILV